VGRESRPPPLKSTGIGHRALKDLRDTFASHLLTAGVQLGYVSSQFGQSDVSVTARHYARWIEGDRYHEPMILEPNEVPADLLASLGGEKSDPTSDPSCDERFAAFLLLADPLPVELFAHIRWAALLPEFDEAFRFGDFEISRICGEAQLAKDRAVEDLHCISVWLK